jgi:hypothetical protein
MAFSSTGSASFKQKTVPWLPGARSQTSLHTDASLRENAAPTARTASAKLVFEMYLLGA